MEQPLTENPGPLTPAQERELEEQLREQWESLLEQLADEIATPEGAYDEES